MMNLQTKNKIIFLDRDGVINIDKHYVYKIEDFEFKEKVFETCIYLRDLGYEFIILTNQSGIARGYYNKDDFNRLTSWMLKEFEKNGIEIKDVFFCPHLPNDNCNCRKPKIGMIEQASTKYSIDFEKSWMIGDKISDMQLAINANIKNAVFVKNSKEKPLEIKALNIKHIISCFDEIKQIIKN
ncbi:D-glycero-beta-D-manno-heptose 1,7-bisphosphate 7-phosphatase [Arcobacter sp. YIC-80]|uniref:D-glycero-beta-D-manno-heptose 1,7-bisphosphate 7-phosphatase n=1 Tax=Arcobacter sp. YIC-80 TaxID=3376683 RepID=UPI003850738F